MKTSKKLLFTGLFIIAFLTFVGKIYAVTPSLSLSPIAGTDNVTISVTGDANASVTLYHYNLYSQLQNRYLGTTNNYGYLSLTISTNNYNITPGGTVYVTVNNQQSPSILWPSTSSNSLNLSISNLILPAGSSATISSTNSVGLYVSSNSNPNVVSALSSVLTNTGCTAGSLYSVTTGLPCSGLYNSNYYSASYVPGCSITSLYSVITGQPCYGGGYNNNYNLTSNGGPITISALSAGSSTLTLCQSGVNTYSGNSCSTIYITVTGNYLNPVTSSYTNPVYDYSNIPIVYSR